MPRSEPTIDADACYRALCSHDARFDGQFFTAVTSTGIYCRPVCRVRTPRRENCLFFRHAAQAELAGFRPCLRCRPELAPLDRHWSTEDASHILVQQATRWLDNPQEWFNHDANGPTASRLAAYLGVSDRHLRRVFDAHLGLSPLQYLLTRKLLAAKQLLADTRLPIAEVALASGFGSQRRFNAAFVEHYGLNPGQLRRQPEALQKKRATASRAISLAWRPPLDAAALLAFFAQRQISGVEWVDAGPALTLRRTLQLQSHGRLWNGWLSIALDTDAHRAQLHVSESLMGVLPSVIWRVRALLDLDADPGAINGALHAHFPQGDGLRVPGAIDGFELAVRAILGQQITVAAARTLAQRLTERLGEAINTPWPELNRLFPTPDIMALTPPNVLGELGIVRQRQVAIQALAQAVLDGVVDLTPHAEPQAAIAALQAIPGIGPWTAQYIAMRALRWPDAWLVGDVALTKALGLPDHRGREAQREAEQRSQSWRPWRSYAVIRAWDQRSPLPAKLAHPMENLT
ncbi:AlkA N-terminal domain-containing protein [Hydrogenophaga sp. PAMC20947]|uniref:AlkA N-terminal domain-containing protein n=1 Tax=Hydrogenophaga sp. PAMC20947 TaxID=2565558 RepID=UPI00109DA68F|nr:AlkA N-terminal domain-containing protein [Hydrogenophaga sp. PAMC20947]QCB46399.1 DNA-3-methyladenine glycosylase 2 family protein [Hydrogenophaga sp. PAMC20947]